MEEHGDHLFKFALARLRDATKAEDMVQEALLAGQEAIEKSLIRLSKVNGSLAGSPLGVKDCTRVLNENLNRRAAPKVVVRSV